MVNNYSFDSWRRRLRILRTSSLSFTSESSLNIFIVIKKALPLAEPFHTPSILKLHPKCFTDNN